MVERHPSSLIEFLKLLKVAHHFLSRNSRTFLLFILPFHVIKRSRSSERRNLITRLVSFFPSAYLPTLQRQRVILINVQPLSGSFRKQYTQSSQFHFNSFSFFHIEFKMSCERGSTMSHVAIVSCAIFSPPSLP